MSRFEALCEGLWNRYPHRIVYTIGGWACVLALFRLSDVGNAAISVLALLLVLALLAVLVFLPLKVPKVRNWLLAVTGPEPVDARQTACISLVRSWPSRAEKLGLVRELGLSPDERARLRSQKDMRQWQINTARERHSDTPMNLDAAQNLLDTDMYLATHVIPLIAAEPGEQADTLLVRLQAVPPLTTADIAKAFEVHGRSVLGLPCDPPVVKEQFVEVVLHLGQKKDWA